MKRTPRHINKKGIKYKLEDFKYGMTPSFKK